MKSRQPGSLDGIESLGIDEFYWSRRYQQLTLVYQIDPGAKRLLWIGKKRTRKTLLRFFRWFGPKRSQALRFVGSDMNPSSFTRAVNWFRARGQLSAHRRGPQRDGPCHHGTSLRIPHLPRRRRLPAPDFTHRFC